MSLEVVLPLLCCKASIRFGFHQFFFLRGFPPPGVLLSSPNKEHRKEQKTGQRLVTLYMLNPC